MENMKKMFETSVSELYADSKIPRDTLINKDFMFPLCNVWG